MAYCPQCLTEYAPGSRECFDCHVPLASGSPAASGRASQPAAFDADLDLVAVRSFIGLDASLKAELAKNLLLAHGMLATLMGEVSSRVMPFHGLVLLRVERKNLEGATEILESFLDNPELQTDPESGMDE